MFQDARKLGEIWFRKGQPKVELFVDTVSPWIPSTYPVWKFNEKNLDTVTHLMMTKFIVRLEKYASQIGLDKFE